MAEGVAPCATRRAMRKRILITGASGFVGRRLMSVLIEHGVDVVGVSRRPPADPALRTHWTSVDCTDPAAMQHIVERVGPDVIAHCAMTSGHPTAIDDKIESLRTAVIGTASVVNAARNSGTVKLVHAGSFLVYAPSAEPLHEDLSLRPSTVRGVAKASAELLVQQAVAEDSLNAVILRIFSVYGPGEPTHRFIPTLLRALKSGESMAVTRWPRHDFVHVDDVVRAMLSAIDATLPAGAVFNIGSGTSVTNDEVIALAERITGRALAVSGEYPTRPVDSAMWTADTRHSQAHLGWTASIPLESGLGLLWERGESC